MIVDCFNDFENEFSAIVYNDGLTSKPYLKIEPPISSKHVSKSETSLSEYDEKERNTLHFGDSFPLDISRYRDGTLLGKFPDTLCFQLGGVRRRMTWRQFILALGLHTEQEMAEAGFGAYWDGSERLIPDKGDLRDYWVKISSDRDFLGLTPFICLYSRPCERRAHRMIAYNISGRGQAPEKYPVHWASVAMQLVECSTSTPRGDCGTCGISGSLGTREMAAG
ncbi:hypothetical protein Tco_0975280 [Tanacetum coccineum]|uniref:Uncharacterized protein n=1 Tax=Tanacetum coccineum TaxID=301880 RepID=A0ABQ5EE04_9ASTR